MGKGKRNAKGRISVTGERALKYRIWRPGDTDEEPPEPIEPIENSRPVLLEVGAVAWVRPANGITKPCGTVDTGRAIAGLFECDTDFRHWLDAREAAYHIAHVVEHFDRNPYGWERARSAQNNRRRLRFDERLRKWVNEFGPLDQEGTGKPERVDNIMRAAHALRAWALRDLSLPERVWSTPTFMLKVDNYAREVNVAAGKCERDPETGEWAAPTLWAALCHSIQHAREYEWKFVECAAPGCFNVFLEKRHKHVTCSQRCGKRMRDRKAKQQRR
jgi:hypothetical protein